MAVTQKVGGMVRPGWGSCTACSLAKYGCPTAQCPHRPQPGRQTAIQPSMGCQTASPEQYTTIESDVPIFWGTESIGIDSLSESNRIDSNRESECSN